MPLDASIPLKANYAIPESPTDTALKEQQIMTLKDALNDPMKKQLEQQKLDAGSLENVLAKQKAVSQVLGSVKDQASLDAAHNWAIQNGLGNEASQLPKVYNEQTKPLFDSLWLRSIDATKAAEMKQEQSNKDRQFGLDKEKLNVMRQKNGIYIDPESGDVMNNSAPTFGFPNPQQGTTPQVYRAMVNEDSKRRQAYVNNRPISENVLRILDQMEPNLDKFQTGGGGETKLGLEKLANNFIPGGPFKEGSTAGANIEKGSNDLATELGKFQYMPGMRGSVLGLQTILASKPGVTQPEDTNRNMMAGLRAKATDYQLSEELAQKYRQASPARITDSNTNELDTALKTIYPIEQVDQKTGKVTFNKDNAARIRDVMDEAIANPKKFIEMAKNGAAAPDGAYGAGSQTSGTGKTISMEQLRQAAQLKGKTEQEAIDAAKAKGYTIQ